VHYVKRRLSLLRETRENCLRPFVGGAKRRALFLLLALVVKGPVDRISRAPNPPLAGFLLAPGKLGPEDQRDAATF
jgi:hypothetical protein